jgi:hypothetical protein
MSDITVHIFHGIKEQIPETFRVNGDIYQDIVTTIMRLGNQSGSIYGTHGEIIDYNALVTLAEVNYIIPSGGIKQISLVDDQGGRYLINYNAGGTYRDVYNAAIAAGLPSNGVIFFAGRYPKLDSRVPADLYKENSIAYLPAGEGVQREARIEFFVKTEDSRTHTVYYYPSGTIRDIYDQLLLEGLPPNGNLIRAGKLLNLDDPISSVDLSNVNFLNYVIPKTNVVTSAMTGRKVDLQVRTPNRGEVMIQITAGTTKASDIVTALQPNSNMKLAQVRRGAYSPYIYQDNEHVYPLGTNERLLLVPDYETLFAGYSAMI